MPIVFWGVFAAVRLARTKPREELARSGKQRANLAGERLETSPDAPPSFQDERERQPGKGRSPSAQHFGHRPDPLHDAPALPHDDESPSPRSQCRRLALEGDPGY